MERIVTAEIAQVLIGRHPLLGMVKEKQASPDGGYLVSTPIDAVEVTLEGIVGDRHAGMTRRADARTPFYPRGIEIRNSRQVSLVGEEELAALVEALGVPTIEAAWLGANLVVRGIPTLSRLPPASRLFFPRDAVLVIADENHPCVYPGKAIQARYPEHPGLAARFVSAALHRRGVVAWVERAGRIGAGDAIRVALPPPETFPYPV